MRESLAPERAVGATAEREETDTLVIGAGPAGLAVCACLRKSGVPFIALERGERVGWAWKGHYERLHLHTARDHSALPHRKFPADFPQYVPRLCFLEYLDAYARDLDVQPRLGEEVVRARRAEAGWETRTKRGGVFLSRRLVVATGYNRVPVVPRWPGQEGFRGEVLHSARYTNGEPWRGRRVLVVGIGNTGGEIAIDLHEHGAEPTIAVRSPVCVVPRDFLGSSTQVTAILMNWLPLAVRDRIGRLVSWLAFGDLSSLGLGRPASGPAALLARGRIPLIDIGTIGLIRRGLVRVAPGVERFEPEGVVFTDGSKRPFDAVILATGYRPQLEDFLECPRAVLDEGGYPRGPEAGAEAPGLYFVGFRNAPGGTGHLRQIARDAPSLAAAIAQARAAEARR
jgi:cation diffusion facilitator CzcD-associated flavoprotein CzcO